MNNYYAVTCKCGHVGVNNYILITFPVVATSKKEAARIARFIPRCKHHHKDCIREVNKITLDEYISLYERNKEDPYLTCRSSREQKMFDLSLRIIPESKEEIIKKETIKHKVYVGKNEIRNPKRFAKYIIDYADNYESL